MKAVWKSRWTSWAPVRNKPTISVDVKQHFNQDTDRMNAALPLESRMMSLLLYGAILRSRADSLHSRRMWLWTSDCSFLHRVLNIYPPKWCACSPVWFLLHGLVQYCWHRNFYTTELREYFGVVSSMKFPNTLTLCALILFLFRRVFALSFRSSSTRVFNTSWTCL